MLEDVDAERMIPDQNAGEQMSLPTPFSSDAPYPRPRPLSTGTSLHPLPTLADCDAESSREAQLGTLAVFFFCRTGVFDIEPQVA